MFVGLEGVSPGCQIVDVRDAVLGDRDAPLVPLADGVGVLEMAEELLGRDGPPKVKKPNSICR